jgi:iron complex transport system substrate-binding protein
MFTLRSPLKRGVIASAFLFAACGDDGGSSSSDTTAPQEVIEATFPLTVPQAQGDLTFESAPERIISLSPTATEMLWAIGAEDQVVAIDNMSNYPAEALEKPNELSGFEPSIEAIAEFDPDLVLVSYAPEGMAEGLAALDIPVWYGFAAVTIDDVYSQIETLGAITGQVENASTVVADMKSQIEEVLGSVDDVAEATYFYELDNTYFTLTSNTFIGSLMSELGLANIADGVEEGNDYPQLNAEVIIEQNPTYIFLADTAYGESAATVAARPGWESLDAVVNGRVVELDSDIASRWGPRVVDLVQAVADALTANN